MKKLLLSLLLLVYGGGVLLLAQDKYQPKYLRQDDKAFKDLTIQTTDNGWIEFKKAARVNPNSFFKDFAANLGLDKDYNFKPLKDETDKFYTRHQRFLLYYKNIAVEGVEFTLHSSVEGILTLADGRIPEGLNADISKPMAESKALDLALANMKVTLDDLKKMDRKKPQGELLLARLSDNVVKTNFKLCYAFDVYGNETLNAYKVYVDAATGEIIKRIPLVHSCFGRGKTTQNIVENSVKAIEPAAPAAVLVSGAFFPNYPRYMNNAGIISFETEIDPSNTARYRLSAFNNTLNTRRITDNNIINPVWSSYNDVTNLNQGNSNSSGLNWSGNPSVNAQTAHWLTQRMYQFISQKFGRNGIDGNGTYPKILTDLPDFDAYWNSNNEQIVFGRSNDVFTSTVTADILGHEYMHAITRKSVGLVYEGESGALDEGISDIFGTALERNILPSGSNPWNWLLGEDLGANRHFRDMANPGSIPNDGNGRVTQPDVYLGNNWFNINPPCGRNTNDFCGVHFNSGVLNRWFNSIVTGNRLNGNTVQGIDFDKATQIVYRALTTYLKSYSNYSDMRNYTIQAAKDLNGANGCAYEPQTVHNAWVDANLGGNPPCTNTCDFNISASSFNSNPACGSAFTLNANCSGANCSGVSYTWTGQGGVRNGQQVSYNTPSTNGVYTYTLTASRSGCSDKSANVTVTVNSCGGGGGGSCEPGNFGGFFDNADCTNFGGWALDFNNFGRTVSVEIRVDGQLVATVLANNSRPDLVNAFGNPAAEYHGWSYSVPANASWKNGQNRTVTARICGANSDLNNSPKTVNCTGGTSGTPPGCSPPSAPNISANPSNINVGGSSTLLANGCNSGTVNWSNGQSGGSISVSPTQNTDYTATCTINNCTSGNSNTATITVSGGGGCPSGNFGGFLDYANCGSIGGWCLDQGNFSLMAKVEILVDGQVVATLDANQNRPDLASAFGNPAAAPHGYTYNIPAGASWRNGNRTIRARPCNTNSDLGNSPMFNVSFNNCRIGLIEDEISTELVRVPLETDLVISPNPTDGILNLKLWLSDVSAVNIEVQDLTGRGVKVHSFSQQVGQFNETLNLSDLPSGMYLLQLKTDKRSFAKKLMVVR